MRRRPKAKEHYDKDVIKRRLAARRMGHARGDAPASDTKLNFLLGLFIILAIAVLGFIIIWITG